MGDREGQEECVSVCVCVCVCVCTCGMHGLAGQGERLWVLHCGRREITGGFGGQTW